MTKEILNFKLKKPDATRNYLLQEIKNIDLMNEQHKKLYRALSYFEPFLVFISAVTGWVSIS